MACLVIRSEADSQQPGADQARRQHADRADPADQRRRSDQSPQPLGALVERLQKEYGPHYYGRRDLHIEEGLKRAAIRRASQESTRKLGGHSILRKEDLDGIKFFLEISPNGRGAEPWVLFRASGTEPLLRIYAEAASQDLVGEVLRWAEAFVHSA